MAKIAELIRHNQGVALSLIAMVVIVIWTFGCEPKVESMLHIGKKVTRPELELEVSEETRRLQGELELLVKRADLKYADLAEQEAIRQKLFEFAAITAEGRTVNPAGVVGLLFSILGVGAVIDNRIKDKVIKNRPLKVG